MPVSSIHQNLYKNNLQQLLVYYTLGLMRLERRRMRSDLIETFKIMNGHYNINLDLFFQLDEGGRRKHGQRLFKRRSRLDIGKYAFCNSH